MDARWRTQRRPLWRGLVLGMCALAVVFGQASGVAAQTPPPVTVQFSANDYTVTEKAGSATITVTLSAASTQQVTVDYATSDGTATAPADYTATSGTLTFAAGVTSQTFTVTVIDDGVMEPVETVNLTLSNPVNATLGVPAAATLWIADSTNPILVNFSQAEYECWEYDASVTITVGLSAASTQQVKVDYATADDTAVAPGDYTTTSGTLTFAASVTTQTFTVTINYEEATEPTEYFKLALSNAVNALLGTLKNAKVKIKEPVVTLAFTGAVMTLLDKKTFTVTVAPVAPAPASSEIQIRRASIAGTWYKLGDGPTKTDWQAKIAGQMKLRGKAVFNAKNYYSGESNLEVQFPSYTNIVADADVTTAANAAWAATKKEATDDYNAQGMDNTKARRREQGYWILLNTGTAKYVSSATVYGAWVLQGAGASVNLTKPNDNPNPAPNDPTSTCTYVVASFHTHTPTAYRDGPGTRGVGPSGGDNAADTADNVPGVVYD